MRRVVITGIGIVSCIGTDKQQVLTSLKEGKPGIVFKEEYKEMGFRSHIAGAIDIDNEGNIYFVHHFYKDGVMIEADIYFAQRK